MRKITGKRRLNRSVSSLGGSMASGLTETRWWHSLRDLEPLGLVPASSMARWREFLG